MFTWLRHRRTQRGQGLVEYAFLLVLVGATAMGSLSVFGGGIENVYQTIICSLGEGGEECGCDYETVTSGPSYTCTGGVFAVEANTSCGVGGTNTELSVLVQSGGTVEEVALTYDAENGVYSTAHTDSTGICARLSASPPASLYLVSRHSDGETVNTFPFGSNSGDDDTGGDDTGDDDTGGDDTGGDDTGGDDTGGDDTGGDDTGGDDTGGDDTGGDDTGGDDTGGDDTGGDDTGGDDTGGDDTPVAVLGISSLTLNFGEVAQGSTDQQTITLTNTGLVDAPSLTVSSITANGDFTVDTPGPVSLAQGEATTITVTFTPSAAGQRSGTLTLTHDGGNPSPQTVSLAGSGTSAGRVIAFIVKTTSLDSNDTLIRNRIEAMGHTVQAFNQNTGTSTVLAANPEAIVISESIDSGNVNTKFRDVAVPVMVHESYLLDDMRMVSSYGWANATTINVLDSTHPAAGGRSGDTQIANSATQLTAGVPAGDAYVVARHTGGQSDQAAIFTFDAGDSLLSGHAAARRVAFPLGDNAAGSFNSTGWAMFEATLTWALNGGSGSGVPESPPPDATLGVSPASISFGDIEQGSTSNTETITLTHTGASGAPAITIDSVTASGDFAVNASTPIMLGQGQSTQITVTFTPTATGTRSGSVTITHNGANASPQTVSLSGSGTPATSRIALVVGSTSLSTPDTLIKQGLEGLGHAVQVFDDSANINSINAINPNLIVISESVSSSTVGTKFRDTSTPVILMEHGLLKRMSMANQSGTQSTNAMTIEGSQSSHPIVSGQSGSLSDNNTTLSYGRSIASGATILGWRSGNPPGAILFVIDEGSSRGRRVFFGVPGSSVASINNNGRMIFFNAVNWAMYGG